MNRTTKKRQTGSGAADFIWIIGLIFLSLWFSHEGKERERDAIEAVSRHATELHAEDAAQVANAEAAADRPSPGEVPFGGYIWEYERDDNSLKVTLALSAGGRFTATLEVTRDDEVVVEKSGAGEWHQQGAILAFEPRTGALGIINGRYSIESLTDGRMELSGGKERLKLVPFVQYKDRATRAAEAAKAEQDRIDRLARSPWSALSMEQKLEKASVARPRWVDVLLVILVLPAVGLVLLRTVRPGY